MSYFKVQTPYSEKQFLVSGASDVLASDSQGQSYASAITINDSAPASETNLWSSQKIVDSTVSTVNPAVEGNLPLLTNAGELEDSGVKVDDAAAASTAVLWTSSKIDSDYQVLASPATAGDLASLTATGQTQDSGVKVDDAAAASTAVLWTSSKIDSDYQVLASPATAGDLASLTATGQTQDSGLKVDDAAAASTSILYSSAKLLNIIADKVFVRGNFNVVTVPNVTQQTLAGTPTQNIGGGWSVNVFTAPKDGYFVCGFIIQNNGAAGVNALSYWEGTGWQSTGINFSNVTFYPNPIAAANVTVTGSGAFAMLAGQQIYFTINNRTGFAQTLGPGDYNTFYIAQL
jgi:hypothetical protein